MAMKETFRNFRKRIFKEFGIKDLRNLFGEVLNSKRRSRLGIGVQNLDKESTWKTIEENMPYWQEEGESFRQARQALNISQRELAEGIGVSPITVGKYEKGKPVRSRKMLRQSGINVMELTQLKREKELKEIKEKK